MKKRKNNKKCDADGKVPDSMKIYGKVPKDKIDIIKRLLLQGEEQSKIGRMAGLRTEFVG